MRRRLPERHSSHERPLTRSRVAWSRMQTTVESTDMHTVKLTVEVPIDELEKDLDKAYRSIANQVKVPGFRKGKVPKRIIDAKVGRDVVVEEFISESSPVYYRRAVTHELPVTDRPPAPGGRGRADRLYYGSSAECGTERDAELAGKRAGGILKFDGPLPERFGEGLGGRQVSFQLLVNDLKARRLPDA